MRDRDFVLHEQVLERHHVFFIQVEQLIGLDLFFFQKFGANWMQHYLDAFVLHFFEVEHEKWQQVVGQEQFPWIIRPREIILIIVCNLHFHVLFEIVWEPFLHIFKNVVELHQLATVRTKHSIGAKVTVHVDQIGLQHVHLLALHDDLRVHLVLVLLKCLVLCLLLTQLPPLLLPDHFLLLRLDFVILCFLNRIVLCLDRRLMVFLGLVDAIDDDRLRTVSDCLILLKEIEDFVHEPWDDLLVHCALSGWY